MFAIDIIVENNNLVDKHDQQYEKWVHLSSDYVFHLVRTGQITNKDPQLIIRDNTIRISVLCPEMNSLSIENCSIYNKATIQELTDNGCTIKSVQTGRDIENPNYSVPYDSSYYIVRFGWESPLLCGDTHRPIPLYKIPATDHDGADYDNIYFWAQDYERLYGLWISSQSYEEFAQGQLENLNTPINQRGYGLAQLIEKTTGVPTYYFLFNYRNITSDRDKSRNCPHCDQKWYIKDKTSSDFVAYKCNNCRLVSELSTNS